MAKRFWWKGVLLTLAMGTTLAMGVGGCLSTTVQRVLVGVLVES